nr:hypothetical protein [Tawny frogmouth aviadenovirus A]
MACSLTFNQYLPDSMEDTRGLSGLGRPRSARSTEPSHSPQPPTRQQARSTADGTEARLDLVYPFQWLALDSPSTAPPTTSRHRRTAHHAHSTS